MTAWDDKVTIVTGGGSGIGRALCVAMAARGARVLVTDIDLAAARVVAAECGSKASAATLDVRDAEATRVCIEQHAAHAGRIDYLFNNAGVAISGEIHEIPLAVWRWLVDVNVYGVLHGVLAVYPIMIRQGFGHIINTASLAGLGPAPLLAPYALSKHAVVGLSNSLRVEAASKGVKVSVMCAAAIETPLLDSRSTSENPVPWQPDVRRFLTALTGPPYPVEKCAQETLAAIERNTAVIVLPGRARLAWRIGRWLPTLVEKETKRVVADERSYRT